jgi:hypothetical protein
VVIHPGQRRDVSQLRVRAEHRDRPRGRRGRRREPAQPGQHGRRDDRGCPLVHGGDAVIVGQRLGEGVDEGQQQHRIAAGRLVARRAELRRRCREPRVDHGVASGPGELIEAQHGGHRLGLYRGEQAGGDVTGLGAGRDDETDREVGDAVGQVGQRPQRRLVGPVRVVDQQDERIAVGEVGGEPVQAVQAFGDACGAARFAQADHGGCEPGRP